MPGIYENNAPETVYGTDVANQLGRYLQAGNADKSTSLGEIFTWRAAWYMMTGRILPNTGNNPVNYAKLSNIAQQLKDLGSMEYARQAWLNAVPSPTPNDLNFNVFLANVWDRVVTEPHMGVNFNGHRDAVISDAQRQSGNLSCAEYYLNAAENAGNRENPEYRYSDKSTYEYNAPENVWRDYAAYSACLQGRGNEKLTDEKIAETKKNAVDYHVLKNRRTVEKLQNGEYAKVKEAYRKTLNSFTFSNIDDLKAAQKDLDGDPESGRKGILEMMGDRLAPPMTDSKEWSNIIEDLNSFHDAKTPEEAALYSADLLMNVEKFTKGRKSLWATQEEQLLVRDCLRAIAVAIPDAVNNPSVKPLINRFNTVRKHRLERRVTLRDYHRPAATDRYPQLPYPGQRALQPAKEKRVMADIYTEIDPITGEAPKARPQQQNSAPQNPAPQGNNPPQGQPQPVPQNKNIVHEKEAPVSQNDKAPEIKNQPDNEDDYAPIDEGNDMQEFLYGEEQPDLAKDFEEMDQYPISLEKAYEDAGDLMNLLKTLSDGQCAQFGKNFMTEQIAKMVALHNTKPFENAPDQINRNAWRAKTEDLKNDPIVQQAAQDFIDMKERRDDFRKMVDASEKQTQEPKNVRFVRFMDGVYNFYKKRMNKPAAEEKEDEKEPQVRRSGSKKSLKEKAPSEKLEQGRKSSVKPKKESLKKEEPKEEEKPEERSSSRTSSFVNNERYTEVSMG